MVNEGIDANALGSIYSEAILFVVVFGVMSIISIIISKRNAKRYELENPLEERKITVKKEALKEVFLSNSAKEDEDNVDKLLELSKMLKDSQIDEEEFKAELKKLNI